MDVLNRTQDIRPTGGMFLSDLITAAESGRSVFEQQQYIPLTAAEAERWKEFNSFESKDHN